MSKVVIIGAGAAGCFAAINAARRFPQSSYILLEATQKPLTKVLVSGGGRCNVTHECFDAKILVQNYPRGSKELIGSMNRFGPKQLKEWFTAEGVSLKAEGDGRVFPTTNKSSTIADCLLSALLKEKVELRKGSRVESISKEGQSFIINIRGGSTLVADKVMIATGSSLPGYKLTKELGHTIEELVPSLFTFKVSSPFLEDLAGQSVSSASLTLSSDNKVDKKKWQASGPLLVTHWGLSGPAVLRLSAFAARSLYNANYQAKLRVNWLGTVSVEECLAQLSAHRESYGNKLAHKTPLYNLSKRLWVKFLAAGSEIKWQEWSKKSLRRLAENLCNHEFTITGKGVFKEEFVTCGGVRRSEIDFTRMESKLVAGLFFSGEVTDVDGVTGGFNFQNAWTSSWIASHHLS